MQSIETTNRHALDTLLYVLCDAIIEDFDPKDREYGRCMLMMFADYAHVCAGDLEEDYRARGLFLNTPPSFGILYEWLDMQLEPDEYREIADAIEKFVDQDPEDLG